MLILPMVSERGKRNSLVFQWIGLCASLSGSMGSIPGPEN